MALDYHLVSYLLIYYFMFMILSLTSKFSAIKADSTSFDCLRSIKDSVEDPLNYLQSWNFNNHTPGFICQFPGVQCWHPDENRVLNLRLSDMGLVGGFPRGLDLCTSLTSLDLSGNELYGPIPSDICGKLFLTTLDLSSNKFSGTIPPEISRCRYLNYLRLDNNQLRGPIPREFGGMDHIRVFSVSRNRLTGPVPHFFNASVPTESYANNLGLCGDPLEPCKDVSADSYVISEESIGGFCMGWPFGFFLFMLSYFFGVPKMRLVYNIGIKSIKKRPPRLQEYHNGGGHQRLQGAITETSKNLKISRLEKYVTRMKLVELIEATSNFSQDNIIAFGTSGITYKAFLKNGFSIAIKRLNGLQLYEEQFISEVLILGTQRHTNLVPLIGFCIENGERFLVYKYMPNGNLYEHLHSVDGEVESLIWPMRMKIALGIANGLAWLHHSWRLRISHCNINSRSILLDGNFEPKISNLSDARISKQGIDSSKWSLFSSSFRSYSQLNPEKRDVYCFGLLLLEIIQFGINTSTELQDSSSSFSLCGAAFSTLLSQGHNEMRLQFCAVARDCMKPSVDQRPTMLEVHQRLKAITSRFADACGSELSLQIE